MVHFIRSVNHRIIDVFIGQTEEVCYCYILYALKKSRVTCNIKIDNNLFFAHFLFHLKFRFILILHFVRSGVFCLTTESMW